MSDLHIVRIDWQAAQDFVSGWHRSHPKPPPGHRFCVGVADGTKLVGVAIVGNFVAPAFNAGLTLEINRTATDGTKNANSMLYGTCWRAAKALGWQRLVTYTQEGESGASLRAAGYRVVAVRKARRGWDTPSRPRDNGSYISTERTLWEAS